MKTLKDFTPEIQAKIPEYQRRVLEPVFSGQKYRDFDFQSAVKCVNWNYEFCGFKAPVVLVAENPYEAQLMFHRIKNDPALQLMIIALDSQLDSQLRSQLDSQLDSQLYSQLRSQLDSQLDSQLRSQLRSQLENQWTN